MGARAGGGSASGGGFGSRSSRPNIIDSPHLMSTGDLLKMSEEGGLGSVLATKELSSRITIEKTGNLVFRNPNGKIVAYNGFSMKLGDAGYVGFSDGVYSNTKKTLTKIMNQGGLTKYKASEIFKPVGTIQGGMFVPFKK
jgi:hypothetical protein